MQDDEGHVKWMMKSKRREEREKEWGRGGEKEQSGRTQTNEVIEGQNMR